MRYPKLMRVRPGISGIPVSTTVMVTIVSRVDRPLGDVEAHPVAHEDAALGRDHQGPAAVVAGVDVGRAGRQQEEDGSQPDGRGQAQRRPGPPVEESLGGHRGSPSFGPAKTYQSNVQESRAVLNVARHRWVRSGDRMKKAALWVFWLVPAVAWAQGGKEGLPTLAPLVESVKGAVVNVDVQSRRDDASGSDEDLLDRFFSGRHPRGEVRSGIGSGFFIDPRGLVLTNNHVVEGAMLDSRAPRRRPRLRGEGARARPAHRRGAAAGEGEGREPAGGEAGRLVGDAGGRLGDGDRQPVRARLDRYRSGIVSRARPQHRRGALRSVPPDRRGDQPGQLGRAALQPEGRGDRHQHRDRRRRHRASASRCRRTWRGRSFPSWRRSTR